MSAKNVFFLDGSPKDDVKKCNGFLDETVHLEGNCTFGR